MVFNNPPEGEGVPELRSSAPPVAKYITRVFVGSIARSETAVTGKLSVLVDHEVPPFVDFHKPPPAAPAKIVIVLLGIKVKKLSRPAFLAKPPTNPVGAPIGPTGTHVAEVGAAACMKLSLVFILFSIKKSV